MRYLPLLLLATTAFGASVDHAYYAPDRGTPYQWFEGAPGIQEFFTKDYRAAGYVYVYVRNDGKQPLKATSFLLDGKPLAELREAQQVVWWRLLPNPVPAGTLGEFMLRLREPLTKTCELTIGFKGGARLTTRVTPQPNPLRIATVGFTETGREVFVVAESLDGQARVLAKVLLDGSDVTAQCRLLAPKFIGDCSPVSLQLSKPLQLGSFHTYTVVTKSGERASVCLKTLDGFVPLGSYGYGTYDEYARNGVNSYANFSKASPGELDAQARLGMRGVSMLGAGVIEPYEVAHRGLYAHYIQDEPDCSDYGFDKLPHALRIGQMAMEMEQRVEYVRQRDPLRPSFLTVDLTYKPANYYIYAPIADVVNPDCYPLTIGKDASMVRESVETCRTAAAARPVTFTFSSTFEGWSDPVDLTKMRFPRPNFPLEQRVMMYYAIGAGARGLFNYIHCTETSGNHWSHGSTDWPELWNEVGVVYRELERVAPLLAVAHPTRLATSPHPKLWLRTLLCGEDAAVIVWVNDNYQQNRMGVRYEPLTDAKITLPDLPWLKGWKAYSVAQDAFTGLKVTGSQLTLPRADVAGLILLTPDARLVDSLAVRYTAKQRMTGTLLLDESRRQQAQKARRIEINRLIAGELGEFAVEGKGVSAYGMKLEQFWNPKNVPYNVFEFGASEATDEVVRGAEYTVQIPAERVGQPHLIYAFGGAYGPPCKLTVVGPGGQALLEKELRPPFAGELMVVNFTPAQAGEYVIKYLQPGKGEKGGRISGAIYVLPASKAFPPLPLAL